MAGQHHRWVAGETEGREGSSWSGKVEGAVPPQIEQGAGLLVQGRAIAARASASRVPTGLPGISSRAPNGRIWLTEAL